MTGREFELLYFIVVPVAAFFAQVFTPQPVKDAASDVWNNLGKPTPITTMIKDEPEVVAQFCATRDIPTLYCAYYIEQSAETDFRQAVTRARQIRRGAPTSADN